MLPIYVPAPLATLPQWIYWQSEVLPNGRLTKVPYKVANWKIKAATSRPDEWATLQQAQATFHLSDRNGLGFVFTRECGLFGIDVDDLDKVAPEDQDAAMRLRMMLREHFPTYREVSPSGKGCHYIGYGRLPDGVGAIKDAKYGIEVYDHLRFFTFTGNVIDGMSTLVDCQDALTELCQTLRGSAVGAQGAYVEQEDTRDLDEIVNKIASWVNGAEFVRLMRDPLTSTLARYKQDHSAADMALANFIAAGTKDPNKAVAIFQRSPLWRAGGKGGYKPEAKYIADYLIGHCFAKVWGEAAAKEQIRDVMVEEGRVMADAIIQKQKEEQFEINPNADAGSYARKFGVELPYLNPAEIGIQIPPGVAGEFVRAVMAGCHTPVPEFAVAISLAFLSGFAGRAYRFKGNGLNSFFMVGAKSSTGKSQHIGSLKTLLASIPDYPQITDRCYMVSGKTVQGMHKYFERAPAGAWITDECGSQVKALTEPSSQGDHELKDAINALFDAAVPGRKWSPPASMRSNNEDKAITCLSVGIGWFTTREKIYSALNDTEIADGFLSRFVPIFYNGVMGEDNFNVSTQFPIHLQKVLGTLWSIVVENDMHMPIDGVANTSKSVAVTADPEAEGALRLFGVEARNLTRRAQAEHDDLPDAFIAMSRVGVTAQRLAAVCAVLDNPVNPVVRLDHVKWAIQFVGSRMLHILELMATGEVGSGDAVEVPTIVRVMKRQIFKHGAKVPSWALHDSLRSVLPFKTARIGAMNAVKQAVNNMIEEGRLYRDTEISGEAGRPLTYYTATKDSCWRKY